LITPDGTPYKGFKVTVGGVQGEVKRSYKEIEAIFKSNEVNFKTHEEHTSSGTFKSYSVST
jgi:hypothetical protein